MTSLYDALYTAVERVAAQNGARCVIAFTDGNDNYSNCTKEDVVNYLKKDIDEGFKKLSNNDLISFLDGLITYKRGEKKDASPAPKIKITKNNLNNILLRKLRIALAFKSYDMIEIFKLGGVEISEGELSALFRSEEHKNYKECGDKYIRVFLKGLIEYCRD